MNLYYFIDSVDLKGNESAQITFLEIPIERPLIGKGMLLSEYEVVGSMDA